MPYRAVTVTGGYELSPSALKRCRLDAGLTPEMVGVALDRSAPSVHGWENGRIVLPTLLIGPLAALYGVNPGAFFQRVDDEAAA